MNDSDIIQGFRAYDPLITRTYFYPYCKQAYKIFIRRYNLFGKSGLDFFSLAHDYYIRLVQENFDSLEQRPKGMSLRNWMIGAFRYVILDALRAYNHIYDHLSAVEPDELLDQLASNPDEDLLQQVVQQVDQSYQDRTMSEIARLIFLMGYKQKEVAAELNLTPSAVNQRYKRMMDQVIIPYVSINYPTGLPTDVETCDDHEIHYAEMSKCTSNESYRVHHCDFISTAKFSDIFDERKSLPPAPRTIPSRPDRSSRTTPALVTSLAEGQVFVFGSNLPGIHVSGAASRAMRFGAVTGQGVGPAGSTYAIPTMHGNLETIRQYVLDFVQYAQTHPEQQFLVIEIGCGIAGFAPSDIAPLFRPAADISNICLPASFWQQIDK